MRPLHAVVVGAALMGLVAAGCGAAIPSSNGGPATLKVMRTGDGVHLADQSGHAVYLFEKDEDRESYCTGACAAVWPPVTTDAMPHGSGGVQGDALGTIKRDDGDLQVTYREHPLYYYAGDASTPGRTKGQELEQFGSEWYLVTSSGKPLESEAPSKSYSGSNTGSTTSGGGGYP